MQFQRNITIEPLVGVDEAGNEVTHAMDQIFVNGVRVGYVGHELNAPISIIRAGTARDKETLAAIEAAVAARSGGQPAKVDLVPQLTNEQSLDIAEGVHTDHDDE